jgi:5-methylcytosine-specific restriction endonuclease McrA
VTEGIEPVRAGLPGGQTYQEYLRSAVWLHRRRRALNRARWRCEQCGSWHRLEVHHLTYARVGAELDTDLTVLCRPCHRRRHEETPA